MMSCEGEADCSLRAEAASSERVLQELHRIRTSIGMSIVEAVQATPDFAVPQWVCEEHLAMSRDLEAAHVRHGATATEAAAQSTSEGAPLSKINMWATKLPSHVWSMPGTPTCPFSTCKDDVTRHRTLTVVRVDDARAKQ